MRSRFEIRAQREAEKEGYFVDFKARTSRPMRGYNQDYFNLYDLILWKQGELRFISIKGKSCPAKHKKDLALFKLPKGCSSELWRTWCSGDLTPASGGGFLQGKKKPRGEGTAHPSFTSRSQHTQNRAGDGDRTRDLLLGKEMFYQLNHAR